MSGKVRPAMFRWQEAEVRLPGIKPVTLKVMIPHKRFRKLCESQFAAGEDYPLAPVENRSMASHNHFFASIQEAFDNLPEAWAQEFPSAEHMRKWVLIEVGFFHLEEHDFDTEKDAKTFASAVRRRDEYARIKRVGSSVLIKTAKSQDHRSMKKEEFQASKVAVLEYLSEVIGVKRQEIENSAAGKVPPRRQPRTEQQGDDR